MSRSVVPLYRVARLGLVTGLVSRSVLAASTAWLAVLAAVYAADAGPPLSALAVTAALLLPVTAWASAAQLAATSADLRQVLVAADGRARVLLADAVPPLLWALGATALSVAANLLLDPHRAPWTDRLVGVGLHLLCGCVGVALALVLHAGRVSRGVQALVVVAGSLASARLAWLPPAGPLLSSWGTGIDPGRGAAAWALLGPVLVTAVLLAVTAGLRRRG